MKVKWLNSRRTRNLFGFALLVPANIILGLLFVNPILSLIQTSLTDKNLLKPKSGEWIGFENYLWMLTEEDFWDALSKSMVYTIGVTSQYYIEYGDCTIDEFKFRGRRICFALILLPWVTSYMASAFVYTLLYGL